MNLQSGNNTLVSICMPAYNAGKYIGDAIQSIVNQSYRNWELIIVDDGSTDQSMEEVFKFNDARIKVFRQANKGQCAAANFALSKSNGDLIKFMDADDLLSVNFIEDQVESLNNQDDVIVSASWGRFYHDDISTFKEVRSAVSKDLKPEDWLIKSWINADAMMQCALWLIPRGILKKSGLWDETLSLINDLDFFTRVILSSRHVIFQGKAILYYRSGIPGSLSDTKSDKAILSAFNSISKATENLLSATREPEACRACANMWQLFIYDVYPRQPQLLKTAEKKIKQLGVATLVYPCGGYTRLLVYLLGWKFTKRIKNLLKKIKSFEWGKKSLL